MYHITSLDEGLELFKVLGSDIRISIIKLLMENPGMNLNELATKLQITNGALTSHIKRLEDCGIISISSDSNGHGNQKICTVMPEKILIDLENHKELENIYKTEIKIGHYSDCKIFPTCGLSTDKAVIGEVDDPRYFTHNDRFNADILWFTKGFVEYNIPNFIPTHTKIDQILLSVELSSEAPGINNTWPSDIYFYLNDTFIGKWISPGDFGDVKGLFTPDWWLSSWNQYGLLKLLVINQNGTFIDGLQISNVSIKDFDLDYKSSLKFKFEVPETAEHVGGLTLFGKTFGNYNQDMEVRIHYSSMEK